MVTKLRRFFLVFSDEFCKQEHKEYTLSTLKFARLIIYDNLSYILIMQKKFQDIFSN